MRMYLCVWMEMFHSGRALTYSTIAGITRSETLHSGWRYSRQCRPTRAAFRSAHSKSASDSTITFSSWALP